MFIVQALFRSLLVSRRNVNSPRNPKTLIYHTVLAETLKNSANPESA